MKDLRAWPKSAVKVVAVTADAFEDCLEDCLASGFDGWLAKPFTIEDLRHILEATFVHWSDLQSCCSAT